MENADNTEIAKFDRLANHWWDSSGAFGALHRINPLRLRYIDQRTNLHGATVLDVGCGGGILSEAMTARGARVTGIDLSVEALTAARQHARMKGVRIDYRHTAVETLAPTLSEHYDVVTCMELLEHVPDPQSVIRACSRLVKPQGNLIFATINRNIQSFIFAIIGGEYILRFLPVGTHQYGKLLKPRELRRWGEECRLQLQDVTGLGYNLFTARYFLTRDTRVNYMAHFKKIH
ncbi:MAG: bifunctional 2-polyprenyl-6-hydroxyphenol methylase/3-demethylubiquinol 3-O-methyltransferase UbiG [Deltaproteobacteria bacterium]|nr:bifunctional 2-polyprenyl-6-hydroxyphenol methylase/3-demethylubiquinol 3-O-methyltransferase UbiG [Deltaproteobacteria bacterium]